MKGSVDTPSEAAIERLQSMNAGATMIAEEWPQAHVCLRQSTDVTDMTDADYRSPRCVLAFATAPEGTTLKQANAAFNTFCAQPGRGLCLFHDHVRELPGGGVAYLMNEHAVVLGPDARVLTSEAGRSAVLLVQRGEVFLGAMPVPAGHWALLTRLEDGSELVLVARIEGQALTLEHPYGGWAWLVGHEGVLRLRRAEVF